MNNNLIKNIFNAFDPLEALQPRDPRYVEAGVERHSAGLLRNLANTIARTAQAE